MTLFQLNEANPDLEIALAIKSDTDVTVDDSPEGKHRTNSQIRDVYCNQDKKRLNYQKFLKRSVQFIS